MRHKKPLSILMSGVLAVALCPAVAFAAPSSLGATGTDLQLQATAVTKQAQTTIYLPAKITTKTISSNGTSSLMSQTTFKYKNGLLNSRTEKTGGSKSVTKWLYKGSNVRAVKTSHAKMVFKLNGKGKKTSGAWTMPGSSSDKIVESYTYTGSRIKKCKAVTYWSDGVTGEKKHNSTIIAYTYKGSHPVKAKINSSGYKYKMTYSYDSHGNIAATTYGSKTEYTNTYVSGLMRSHTEIAQNEGDDVISRTYTYKAVKVKDSLAAKVKQQRWAILNENLNYALGGYNMH